jgi:HK97 family phage major capsid protein
MSFSDNSLKAMYQAFRDRQPLSIKADTKAFSTVESLLPPELDPNVVAHIHEWRILDRLPAIPISAPSYEFIIHNFSADSGGPGVVAEGAAKPEYVPAATSSTVTAVKLAMHTGISYETLADWQQWLGYVQTECFKQMMDLENSQLLNGSGSGGNIPGFFQTSGILMHNCASNPGSYTAIDSIEAATTQLRIGSALAEPDLFICHPSSWASIRRIKSTTNTYVVGDPLHQAVNTIWGVPVLITTACTNGSGLLLDTKKFGRALIREGIVMHQGFSGTDFIDNIVRYVFEQRLSLAVERPQAVLALSNLPTS